jgi:hypothetical protein
MVSEVRSLGAGSGWSWRGTGGGVARADQVNVQAMVRAGSMIRAVSSRRISLQVSAI